MLDDLGVEVVAEAENAKDVLQSAETTRAHVAFLDIEMPGINGLKLAEILARSNVAIVFVTGYSEHAVKAFDQEALDYLLKPVSPERLAQTLARVRLRVDSREKEAAGSKQRQRGKRLVVRGKNFLKLLRIDRVLYAVVRNQNVYVGTLDGEQKTSYTLSDLEEILPKSRFMRTHASSIVDLDVVDEIHMQGNHTYSVRLRNGLELPLSRSGYGQLKDRFGLSSAKEDQPVWSK